jgi:hypothetical protein
MLGQHRKAILSFPAAEFPNFYCTDFLLILNRYCWCVLSLRGTNYLVTDCSYLKFVGHNLKDWQRRHVLIADLYVVLDTRYVLNSSDSLAIATKPKAAENSYITTMLFDILRAYYIKVSYFLDAFAKLLQLTISLCLSVSPAIALNSSVPVALLFVTFSSE